MNIIISSQNEIIIALSLKEKLPFDTESIQIRNKVVSESFGNYREAMHSLPPYLIKFIDYIEILRAPPHSAVIYFLINYFKHKNWG